MDIVIVVLGSILLATVIYGYFREHWSANSTLLAAVSAVTYIGSGLERNYVGALVGSVIFAFWLPQHIRERLNRPRP